MRSEVGGYWIVLVHLTALLLFRFVSFVLLPSRKPAFFLTHTFFFAIWIPNHPNACAQLG